MRLSWHTPDCLRHLIGMAALWLTMCSVAFAHEGPPFPVLMDEPIPGYRVSVWADPDIGTGKFYVVTESPNSANSPPEPQVEVWVEPVSKRLPKVTYVAHREDVRNWMQFLAEPEFDAQELWNVGIVVTAPEGTPHELQVEVEATPPGMGPWDLAIYLFPFLMFGGLWGVGLIRSWHANDRSNRKDLAAKDDSQNNDEKLEVESSSSINRRVQSGGTHSGSFSSPAFGGRVT